MIPEWLQERAAAYAAGAMAADEREAFEILLAFDDELRGLAVGWQETLATAAVALSPPRLAPSQLKSRVLAALGDQPKEEADGARDALVVADDRGRVLWVNAEFTRLCGYSLEELRGKKPGSLLQGPRTDAAAVDHLRRACREGHTCRQELVNYHKSGRSYRVDIRVTPILDDASVLKWLVARERELPLGTPA